MSSESEDSGDGKPKDGKPRRDKPKGKEKPEAAVVEIYGRSMTILNSTTDLWVLGEQEELQTMVQLLQDAHQYIVPKVPKRDVGDSIGEDTSKGKVSYVFKDSASKVTHRDSAGIRRRTSKGLKVPTVGHDGEALDKDTFGAAAHTSAQGAGDVE